MCENARYVHRKPDETPSEYADRFRAETGGRMEFACNACGECASCREAKLVMNVIAQKARCQRCIIALLTYNDAYLVAKGRPVEDRDSIERTKPDAARFVYNVRKMLRRLHPDMLIEVKACRVTEIAKHRTDNEETDDRRDLRRMSAMYNLPDWMMPDVRREKVKTVDQLQTREPRAHHHVALFFNVAWKDADRQQREPAQWSDDLIPHLRLGQWLYDHVWENKQEARIRGGRVRKLAMPWEFGMISYSNSRGAEGFYFAKYLVKCIRLRAEWWKLGCPDWSGDERKDYDNAYQSMLSVRCSPGLGYEYYKEQAEKTAEAGLALSLSFEFRERDIHPGEYRETWNSRTETVSLYKGGPFARMVKRETGDSWIDEFGRVHAATREVKVRPTFLLLRPSRQRVLIHRYDERWAELYGRAPQPRDNALRRKQSGSWTAGKKVYKRFEAVVTGGLTEARASIETYEDRLALGKRERALARLLRENTKAHKASGGRVPLLLDEKTFTAQGRVFDEMAMDPRRRFMPVLVRGRCFQSTNDKLAVVKSWEQRYKVEVVRKAYVAWLGEDDEGNPWGPRERGLYGNDLFLWLRLQIALLHLSDDEVREVRRRIWVRYESARCRNGLFRWAAWHKGRMKAGHVCG